MSLLNSSVFGCLGVGVNLSPFSKSFISVLLNLRFDKLTICKSVTFFAIDSCIEFGLGTKKSPCLGFDYILYFGRLAGSFVGAGLGDIHCLSVLHC